MHLSNYRNLEFWRTQVTYTEHNDAKGRDARRRVEDWRALRARMLATITEYDFGAVTLYMSKYELQARCRESAYTGTTRR